MKERDGLETDMRIIDLSAPDAEILHPARNSRMWDKIQTQCTVSASEGM